MSDIHRAFRLKHHVVVPVRDDGATRLVWDQRFFRMGAELNRRVALRRQRMRLVQTALVFAEVNSWLNEI